MTYPCKCDHLDDTVLACLRVPKCAYEYHPKISGPLFYPIDLHVEISAVNPVDLSLPPSAETNADVAKRVTAEPMNLTVRGYRRFLRVAHTFADPDKLNALEWLRTCPVISCAKFEPSALPNSVHDVIHHANP